MFEYICAFHLSRPMPPIEEVPSGDKASRHDRPRSRILAEYGPSRGGGGGGGGNERELGGSHTGTLTCTDRISSRRHLRRKLDLLGGPRQALEPVVRPIER